MDFKEKLPAKCPPESAIEISSDCSVFRLCKGIKATEADFLSHQALNPHKNYGSNSCKAAGLSTYKTSEDVKRVLALPKYRGHIICEIKLRSGAGMIQQTGDPAHHTWWPARAFDILKNCAAVNA